MPKETPQQKAERLAREEAAAQAALEKYYATVPRRLMDALALARSLGVTASVDLLGDGPIVSFEYESEKYRCYIDYRLTYQCEEWELETLENQLMTLKAAQENEKSRLESAKKIWESLSALDKAVIKEFINLLK